MRRGAEGSVHREDLVAVDELVGAHLGLGGVVGVVVHLEVDLAAVDPTIGVDVLEVGLSRRGDVLVAGCRRSREGRRHADGYLGLRHPRVCR